MRLDKLTIKHDLIEAIDNNETGRFRFHASDGNNFVRAHTANTADILKILNYNEDTVIKLSKDGENGKILILDENGNETIQLKSNESTLTLFETSTPTAETDFGKI